MRMLIAATIATMPMGPAVWAAPSSAETALSQLTAERDAGKPVDCLLLRRVQSSRIVDRTAIIFDAAGTLYLNRPTAGAELLVNDKAIVTATVSGEICTGEAVQLFDPASGVQSGSVFLGKFIPYRKKSRAMSAPSSQAPASRYW
jgi:hypothetical protein